MPRLTNPSRFVVEIAIFGFGFLLHCRDSDSGCHCIWAMCARIEAGNDQVKVQALGLCSAMQFALELGPQDLVVECEIK